MSMFLNNNFALPYSSLEMEQFFQPIAASSQQPAGLIPLGMNQMDSFNSVGVLQGTSIPNHALLFQQPNQVSRMYTADDLYTDNSDLYFSNMDQQKPLFQSFAPHQRPSIVIEKGGEEINCQQLLYGKNHIKQETALVNMINTPDEKDIVSPVVTTQAKKNAFWTIRSYENCPATVKVQVPQFKYCKKKRNHFSQDFPQIAYKSPYKYNLRLSVGCNCGNKGNQPCCRYVKSWAEEVRVSLDLVLEDTLQTATLPDKTSMSPISLTDTHFNTDMYVNGSSFEAVMSAFQMNVCSYNMGGSKFRLIVKISKEEEMLMSLISPSFVIKAKKPIWKPGIKNRNEAQNTSEKSIETSDCAVAKKTSRKKRTSKQIEQQEKEVQDSDEETKSSENEVQPIVVTPPSPKRQKKNPTAAALKDQSSIEGSEQGTTTSYVPTTPPSPLPYQTTYSQNNLANLMQPSFLTPLLIQQILYQKQLQQFVPQQMPQEVKNTVEEPFSSLDFLLFEELGDSTLPLSLL